MKMSVHNDFVEQVKRHECLTSISFDALSIQDALYTFCSALALFGDRDSRTLTLKDGIVDKIKQLEDKIKTMQHDLKHSYTEDD